MRILVTGSRDWPDPEVVFNALFEYCEGHWEDTTIVHGDCPTGADYYADLFCGRYNLLGVKVERHPADWKQFGKFAGPKRNKEMVALGADIVLAFPMEGSRGTKGCIKLAKEAGLAITVYSLDGTAQDW